METIKKAVEKYRQLIYDAEKFIWQHPETGYKEFVTSQYMKVATLGGCHFSGNTKFTSIQCFF